jgi:leucyl aminopeptidase (aminopeptidase T)
VPTIGANFEEIFAEIVKINTLDAVLYQKVQQKLIDALDKAKFVKIKGKGANKTDLTVYLHELENPEKQTIFENCVADVNIPVGEVFTSPKLLGTTGILHVTSVYLNELLYKDLKIEFADGLIRDYRCSNFANEADNQKFVRDNVLFGRDTLPLGEFAIGTNTAAYQMAKKFDIADKLPILIAEKMGPHFAVGDTCYSHQEEVKVYNPDSKEIVARDNEVTLENRKEHPERAYFQCHTDITIPYDELGSIVAFKENGEEISLIEDGKFVLEGTEVLNEYLK